MRFRCLTSPTIPTTCRSTVFDKAGRAGTASDRIVRSPIQLRGVLADEQHLRIALDDVASTQHRNPHGTAGSRG